MEKSQSEMTRLSKGVIFHALSTKKDNDECFHNLTIWSFSHYMDVITENPQYPNLNKIHERALLVVYPDNTWSFDELLK